ncbi:MAG TPA: sensor histidine kinase, partial [Bacteroidetes bacterium]|nr:sensor histidine kinase [Bacteroidota bacterium]
LISNLFKNAIKNNYENGYIKVEIKNNYLKFSNTSNSPALDREKIFNRFYKSSSNSDSVGLGLSIVKKICDLYSLKIEYSFENNIHHFKILNNN